MNPSDCNVIMDCMDFWETWENLKQEDDVFGCHCGTHPQNVRRLLRHDRPMRDWPRGTRTIEVWSQKYARKLDALRPKLREEQQKFASGGSKAPPHLVFACVCKSGRDRSVGMAIILQCLFASVLNLPVVVEHLCRSDWRHNEGCKLNCRRNGKSVCRYCLQPDNSKNDVIAATREVEYLNPKFWSPEFNIFVS